MSLGSGGPRYGRSVAGFGVATAVARRRDSSAYDVELDPQWTIAGKPNGGYLLAVLARAAVHAAGSTHPHPLAVSAHYLHAPEPRGAAVEVDVLRRGRSASQLRVRLRQDERTCVEALLTLGLLGTTAPWWGGEAAPALPPPEDCVLLPSTPPGAGYTVPILDVLALRLDPETVGWAVGRPSGRGELRGWATHVDGLAWDEISLLTAVDAFPPATFDLGSTGWVPTLELTAYVRALPAPGPLVIRQRARLVQDGRVDEACDVWDSRGALVAQATQLASIRVPDAPPQHDH